MQVTIPFYRYISLVTTQLETAKVPGGFDFLDRKKTLNARRKKGRRKNAKYFLKFLNIRKKCNFLFFLIYKKLELLTSKTKFSPVVIPDIKFNNSCWYRLQ